MKIYIANDSKQSMGGGWTFIDNFIKGLQQVSHERVHQLSEADVVLVPSSSMITPESWDMFGELKIPRILRIDNMPRNSRNRNTGASRLRRYAQEAEGIVWQSSWAKWYLDDFLGRYDGEIIINGVDTTIFKEQGVKHDFTGGNNMIYPVYLYVRSSRDETKHWEVAWYKYQIIQRENPSAKLVIVGRFSDELRNGNFDFFRNERFEYMGVIEDPNEMASIYRGAHYLLATFFIDACPNTYLEALACGVQLFEPNMSGGVPEIIGNYEKHGVFTIEEMTKKYIKYFEKVLNK